MKTGISGLRGAALLAAALDFVSTGAAHAQAPSSYPPYAPYPTYQASPYPYASQTPPSWNYDPYTSGLTSCPQRTLRDPPCSELMQPTYGQPNYRVR